MRDGGPDAAPAAGDVYVFPASFAQQRLWLLDRLVPDGSVYNVPKALRLAGALDVGALSRALDGVVARHEVLRTRIGVDGGVPVQVVAPELRVGLDVIDLRRLAAPDREAEARRLAGEFAGMPFRLARGPLLRARLLRLDDGEHWFLLTLHHIVTDAWSSVVLGRELSVLYNAACAGAPSPLPALPIQYADYAIWQREWLQGEVLAAQLAYWKPVATGLPVLELPTDRPRPALADSRGGRFAFELDASLTAGLAALSRREGATLFMTLLAAFQVLLYRWSGQTDIAVGVPTAGRTRPELDGLVGFFVNTLLLRADLAGTPTFAAHLAGVRKAALDAYAHQDLPFEKLVEHAAAGGDLSCHPLFQVMFALQNTQPVQWSFAGLEATAVEGVGGETSKFDLSFSLVEEAGAVQGRVVYAAALFDAATIERMADHYRTLLRAIVAAPDARVDRLPLQDAAGRHRLLVEWNRTTAPYPDDSCVHRLVEAVAARAPAAPAVIDGPVVLTYGELNARANALAHLLRERTRAPRIGVCLERGADLVVAMLAILKADAAYVPLDPELPVERLSFMLADAGVALTVTSGAMLPRLPATGGQVLCIDRDAAAIATRPAHDHPRSGSAAQLAYVMYTSGSSGAPKGVPVAHRAIARLVCGTDYIRLDAADVVAHVANPAFDAATFEVWGALVNGARLVVVPRMVALSPQPFAALLHDAGITTIFLTTALFNQMAREAPAAFRGCRTVLFGGEAVEPGWVRAVLAAGPPARLLHVYGPTEATTFATWHEVRAVPADASTIPIGRPIANTEAYILDAQGEPVPVGVPGELHLGGPGLAAGYLGQPELTASRFVPHPFSADPDARLYRTGDRARYRADGAIVFLGRLDRQIKLRGHRIEPREIEAALCRLPQVADAAVVMHGTQSADRRLAAYIVPAAGAQPVADDVWRGLRRSLPEYMIPAALVLLPALPLTSNGKIDRAALPDPSDLASQRRGYRIPPQDLLQNTLAKIWEDLLGIEHVGIRDSFFDIGGHSLLASRMMDRVNAACGCDLPLTTLFTESTIEYLAAAVRGTVAQSTAPVVAINAGGRRPPIFFLHGDFVGGGFYARPLGAAGGPDQPFYAVHPNGLETPEVPSTIEAMASNRLAAIRQVRPTGPYILGGHCNGALVAVEIARQLIAAGESVPLVLVIDAKAPWSPVRLFDSAATGGRAAAQAPGPAPAQETGSGADPIGVVYVRAMAQYRPAPYPGRIAVLRSGTVNDMRPTLGWSLLCKSVTVHALDGDHQTAMTHHVAATGARIAACVAAAIGAPGAA